MFRNAMTCLAAAIFATSASAEQLLWEAFPTYEYDQVLQALESKYGPADRYYDFVDCKVYMCEGRSAYWYEPDKLFIEIHNSAWVAIYNSCPDQKLSKIICNEIEGIPNKSNTAEKILNLD